MVGRRGVCMWVAKAWPGAALFAVVLAGLVCIALALSTPALAACTPPNCGPGSFPDATWVPYALDSPFNARLNAVAVNSAVSDPIVHNLVHGGLDGSKPDYPSNFAISREGHAGWPTYYAVASDPLVTVTCGGGFPEWNGECPTGPIPAIHVPSGAGPNPRNVPDKHMTVVDQAAPGGPIEYDLYQVQADSISGGSVHVGGIGWERVDTSHGVTEVQPGRATASGFGNLAGRIRAEEFAAALNAEAQGQAHNAVLRHAISVAVACVKDGAAVAPALNQFGQDHTSGTTCTTTGDAPPMGARFRLQATEVEITAATHYPWQRVLLRTMREYGIVVNDTGSGGGFMTLHQEAGWQYTHGHPTTDAWWAIVANDPCAHPTTPDESPITGWQPFEPASGERHCVGHFGMLDRHHKPAVDPLIWDKLVLVDFALATVAPATGPAAGGTQVKIHGSGLLANATVTFGGTPAPVVGHAPSGGSLTVQAPSHAPGAVDVKVTQDGRTATLPAAFGYTPDGDTQRVRC